MNATTETFAAIENNAIINANNLLVDKGINTLVVPDDSNMLNLEPFMDDRARQRGTFRTNDFSSYITYMRMVKTPVEPVVFIDKNSSTAIINYKSIGSYTDAQGHCDFKAQLNLVKTPEVRSLLATAGNRITQTALAEWLEDNADFITCTNSIHADLSLGTAINAVRNIKVQSNSTKTSEVKEFGVSNSALDSIAVDNTANNMPSYITFTADYYQSLDISITFNLRVSVMLSGDKPELILRLVNADKYEQQAQELLAKAIQSQLEGLPIYLGEFNA